MQGLLSSIGSLEEADQKIDALAAEGKIDPAFLLTMARAYSGVKESPMTRYAGGRRSEEPRI